MASSSKKNPIYREGKCGTTKGWNAHQQNGEEQHDECRQAKTDYTREWRRRTGRTKYTLVPIDQEEQKPVQVSIAHMEGIEPFAYIKLDEEEAA